MRTSRSLLLMTLVTLFLSPLAKADGGPWGLGLILVNPTGFSGKYRFSPDRSLDAALGYSFGRSSNVTIHSTYLWEFNRSIKLDNVALGHYFGVGGSLYSRDRNDPPPSWATRDPQEELGLAVRGVAGLNYYFQNPAIEVFAETALNFFFVPSTRVNLGIALGARYFF